MSFGLDVAGGYSTMDLMASCSLHRISYSFRSCIGVGRNLDLWNLYANPLKADGSGIVGIHLPSLFRCKNGNTNHAQVLFTSHNGRQARFENYSYLSTPICLFISMDNFTNQEVPPVAISNLPFGLWHKRMRVSPTAFWWWPRPADYIAVNE